MENNQLPRQKRSHYMPPCGGMHTEFAADYCYDCRDIRYKRDVLVEMRRANELRESRSGIPPSERREPHYIPPTKPEPGPKIERRGA